MIIPQGAVEQPVRVTCRYLRSGSNDRQLLYPPPLMEREALASRVIEMGPAAASFKSPVLLEVPHFASLRDGERELIVLRSDDGETWQEHTMAYFSGAWCNGNNQEAEIYEDFVVSSGISPAYEVLDTDRVVRISTQVFPKYFAILSRIKEEVRVIGADGGKIEISHTPHLQVYFPSGALQKRIKVALQIQKVPTTMLSIICPGKNGSVLHLSPLVALEPRRRRFHSPVQVMVPLPKKASPNSGRRIRLLCSLTGNATKANWEDVTAATSFVVRSEDRLVIFETKVSALFWAVAIDVDTKEGDKEKPNTPNSETNNPYEALEEPDYEDIETILKVHKDALRQASRIYDELILSPYMARILVLHRPHTPHAWCDSLRIYCVTDDKAELTFDAKQQPDTRSVKSATVGGEEWRLLVQSEELEVSATSNLRIDLSGGNLIVANDCQIEFGYRQTLRFQPFQNNSCTLLVKSIDPNLPKSAKLDIRRSLESDDSNEIVSSLCTLDITLDTLIDKSSVSPSVTLEDQSLDALETPDSQTHIDPKSIVSLTSHVANWNTDSKLFDGSDDNKEVEYVNVQKQPNDVNPVMESSGLLQTNCIKEILDDSGEYTYENRENEPNATLSETDILIRNELSDISRPISITGLHYDEENYPDIFKGDVDFECPNSISDAIGNISTEEVGKKESEDLHSEELVVLNDEKNYSSNISTEILYDQRKFEKEDILTIKEDISHIKEEDEITTMIICEEEPNISSKTNNESFNHHLPSDTKLRSNANSVDEQENIILQDEKVGGRISSPQSSEHQFENNTRVQSFISSRNSLDDEVAIIEASNECEIERQFQDLVLSSTNNINHESIDDVNNTENVLNEEDKDVERDISIMAINSDILPSGSYTEVTTIEDAISNEQKTKLKRVDEVLDFTELESQFLLKENMDTPLMGGNENVISGLVLGDMENSNAEEIETLSQVTQEEPPVQLVEEIKVGYFDEEIVKDQTTILLEDNLEFSKECINNEDNNTNPLMLDDQNTKQDCTSFSMLLVDGKEYELHLKHDDRDEMNNLVDPIIDRDRQNEKYYLENSNGDKAVGGYVDQRSESTYCANSMKDDNNFGKNKRESLVDDTAEIMTLVASSDDILSASESQRLQDQSSAADRNIFSEPIDHKT